MAFALQAPDDAGTVGTFFKCAQDMNDIDLAGTRNTNNFDICRIIQSHRTCQVRGGISSEIAAKSDNNRFKILAHVFLAKLKNDYLRLTNGE
jgi:hypothetical protein